MAVSPVDQRRERAFGIVQGRNNTITANANEKDGNKNTAIASISRPSIAMTSAI